jgi:hypothetical protein
VPNVINGVLEAALAAIKIELKRVEPIHEGLRDYARLDLHPDTLRAVKQAIALYDRRVKLLEIAAAALEALLHGEAEVPTATAADIGSYAPIVLPPVSQEVYDDLADNQRTITAAFGEFHVEDESNEAASVDIAWGKPEEQKE